MRAKYKGGTNIIENQIIYRKLKKKIKDLKSSEMFHLIVRFYFRGLTQ
jgi:hypothetical protein